MNKKNTTITIICLFIISIQTTHCQVFTGLEAFKNIIEFESQRYLMNEVYGISTQKADQLAIDRLIVETDNTEGFMFVMTAYKFNGEEGIVFTSFNSRNFGNTEYHFINVHLSKAEFENLNLKAIELGENTKDKSFHQLFKFNERLTIDVFYNERDFASIALWIDQYNRHTFTTTKWDKALNRLNDFFKKN